MNNSYLMDKSVKKVSLATLRRRKNQQTDHQSKLKEIEKVDSPKHTSIFS